ncbi:MAG: peptidylprolyl isomerase [Terrimicrobiaceae bacterium]
MNKILSLALSLSAVAAMLSACKPSQPAGATPAASPSPQAAAPAATPGAVTTTPVPAADAAAAVLKDPVAVVNGEKVTKSELEEAFNSAVQASGAKVDDLTADQKLEGYRQLLDELILDKLVSKAAEGVVVPQADIDSEVAKIKGQFPSEEEFNKQIIAAGQSPEKFNDALKKMLQQQKWIEGQVGDKTAVTDADAKKFYDSNTSEFNEPETVKASHILILVGKDDSEDVAKQKLEIAKKAAARAKKGEDFTKLAKELSQEPGAKESGGDLGFFPKDQMVPEFSEAAFNQKVGQISEPVRTQFGWHVIKVTDKKPAGVVPYEQVKKQLLAYLKTDKQRKAVQELLKSLRDSAKIENTLPAPAAPAMPQLPVSDKPGS